MATTGTFFGLFVFGGFSRFVLRALGTFAHCHGHVIVRFAGAVVLGVVHVLAHSTVVRGDVVLAFVLGVESVRSRSVFGDVLRDRRFGWNLMRTRQVRMILG